MAQNERAYRPDYAVPPGAVLVEMIESQEMSHAEFARRCGRSPKLISEIIAGKAPIEPETALQFERVLGMDASVWLNMESAYQLHQAHAEERRKLEDASQWATRFPLDYLVQRKAMKKPANEADAANLLLAFFGVGTVAAWQQEYAAMPVQYRQSPKVKSSPEAIAVWLRLGEIAAAGRECAEYDRARFLDALRNIRATSRLPIDRFRPEVVRLCAAAGVVVVLMPSPPKTALSGVARWLTPRKALIQQSLRYKTNDHFWFTFYHEAAHLLLHSKRDVFVDDESSGDNAQEVEANSWASNFLIPKEALDRFVSRPVTEPAIVAFAADLGIDPGIVVGRLQHDAVIAWNRFNGLKSRFVWVEE